MCAMIVRMAKSMLRMILQKGGEGHGLLRRLHPAVCHDNLQPHGVVVDGSVVVDIFERFEVRNNQGGFIDSFCQW